MEEPSKWKEGSLRLPQVALEASGESPPLPLAGLACGAWEARGAESGTWHQRQRSAGRVERRKGGCGAVRMSLHAKRCGGVLRWRRGSAAEMRHHYNSAAREVHLEVKAYAGALRCHRLLGCSTVLLLGRTSKKAALWLCMH
jgi:hypothetical protein